MAGSAKWAVTLQKAASPGAVLITGATGYIGGRLLPVLEGAGVRLRCVARRPAALASRVSPTTEVVAGDLLDPMSLDRALAGIALRNLIHADRPKIQGRRRTCPGVISSR